MIIVLLIVTATASAYPKNMNRENCEKNGIYWIVGPGELVPCSPTCDETYTSKDKNEVHGKTINAYCKLDTTVGQFYHEIASERRCACTNGAAYKEVASMDWSSLRQVSKWFCIPASQWKFETDDGKKYYVVCL